MFSDIIVFILYSLISIRIVKPCVAAMYAHYNGGDTVTVDNGAYVDIAFFTQNSPQNRVLKSYTPYAEQLV